MGKCSLIVISSFVVVFGIIKINLNQVGGATGWAVLEDNGSDTSLSASNVRITAGGASGNAVDSAIVLAQLASVPPDVTAGSLPILWSSRLAP